MIELMPSPSRPPWTRLSRSSPVAGMRDAMHEAAMSPIVSADETKYAMRMGRKYSGAKPSGYVVSHRKTNRLASRILSSFQYLYLRPTTAGTTLPSSSVKSPSLASYRARPLTKQPKMRPQKKKVDFKKGEPKNWMRTDMAMTEKPRPMYSGAPNGNTTLPFSLHSCGEPNDAERERSFSAQKTPPPTYLMPDEMSEPPMSITAAPVTTVGNIFWRSLMGKNEMMISRKAAAMAVPRNLPYPFLPKPLQSPSDEHLPSLRASLISEMTMSRAMGRNVKDVPITETRPVPK
mmetsp:Transcript_20087/g.80140  ORF Transcript_20087/g.80140 Transcript_20087/m.80140 type:complete len:290 (-) Transcript_20087:568-1437(-)